MLVKAAKPGRVALWERNPAHPTGEVFIHRGSPVEVAETAAVLAAVKDGRLVVVEDVRAQTPEPEPAPKPRTRRTKRTRKASETK